MDINKILKERQKWFEWKNIKPIFKKLNILKKEIEKHNYIYKLNDFIEITGENIIGIEKMAKMLKPWRKGPFKINNLFIDMEWKSYIIWNPLNPHLN